MPTMDIHLAGEDAFKDVPAEKFVEATGASIRVAALAGGMKSGKPSIGIGIMFPDGSCVLAQTSLSLFLTAADAFKARFGDPRT